MNLLNVTVQFHFNMLFILFVFQLQSAAYNTVFYMTTFCIIQCIIPYVLYYLFYLSRLFQRYVSILDWENETLWSPKYHVSIFIRYSNATITVVTVFTCVCSDTFFVAHADGSVKLPLGLDTQFKNKKITSTSSVKEGLYRIQILCRRNPFWSYPTGLTIAHPPG